MASSEGLPHDPGRGPFSPRLEPALLPLQARLPRGRHGLPRDFIERNQRNRVLSGAIDSVAERGYLATTIADVTRHACVSRTAFYRHFASKEDCFLTAHEMVIEWFERELCEVTTDLEGWPQRIAAAVAASLRMFDEDPRLPRFGVVEVFHAGPVAASHHKALLGRLAASLRAGRAECSTGAELPPQLEQTLLAGTVGLIASYVNDGREEQLSDLGPDLTETLLLPYLGLEPARRVARAWFSKRGIGRG
jgi:AcrR family transcriptional regulator